ncbi:MAG TPA: phosphate/phosphite/phosphonate ABC transporter substrate-binding protein [Pirellulales bacterium]|jgi:phosphonate transport system substrate-binding protein
MSSLPDSNPQKPPFSLGRVLMVVIPALIVIGAVYAVKSREFDQDSRLKDDKFKNQLGFHSSKAPMHLDPKFTDVDSNLVADAPQDPAKQVTPDHIIFAFLSGPDAEKDRANWKEFVAFLQEKTGKPIDMVTYQSTEDEIQALKDGKLHVAGFNTGAVPLAVNTAGFVPICTRAGDDGKFSDSMEIIVPAKSEIRENHLEDIKGHTIAFAERTSNSGYKAAVLLLKAKGMELPRDYSCRFSGGHSESIKGIAAGEYEVGSVSREVLNRAISLGDVSKDKVRIVYESERFPPATLGYVYNLSPALGEKIKAAFLDFPWKGTGLENQFAGSGSTKFVPVSYKDDFALIIRNNDEIQDPVDVPEGKPVASSDAPAQSEAK